VTGVTESGGEGHKSIQYILLFGLVLSLPGLQSSIFGLVYFFIPLLVLFYLYKWEHGSRFVIGGVAVAVVISSLLGALGTLLFSATFIPVGYSLAHSAFRSDSPSVSGVKGTITLLGCWLLLLGGYILVTNSNPITDFLGSLDHGVEEALAYYQQNEAVEADTIALIEQSFYQMKVVLPKIMPSLLIGFSLLTVWFTMVTGNNFVQRFTGYQPWTEHRLWQLPDRLVWLLIGSIILSLLPLGNMRLAGINSLIVFSFVYFFQGFSIFVFFMNKWNVPLFLRALFYGMMLFQSFGTMLLLVIGIGDVWINIRRLNITEEQDTDLKD